MRGRDRNAERHLVMATDTNRGLSSLVSAAAVDHTDVTVGFLALHHSLSPCIQFHPA